jgi:hypothetical protein
VTIATNTRRTRGTGTPSEPQVAGAPRAAIATRLHQREAIAITSPRANACGGHRDADAITRYGIGQQGVEMTGEEAEISEGIEEEMESTRRVKERVAEFAARRAGELAHIAGPSDRL